MRSLTTWSTTEPADPDGAGRPCDWLPAVAAARARSTAAIRRERVPARRGVSMPCPTQFTHMIVPGRQQLRCAFLEAASFCSHPQLGIRAIGPARSAARGAKEMAVATTDSATSTRAAGGVIRTLIPARIDRLPWSRFHTRVIAALGVAWVLDGLEITFASNMVPHLEDRNWLG